MKYQNADKKNSNGLTLESSSLQMTINANEEIYQVLTLNCFLRMLLLSEKKRGKMALI